MSATAGPVVLCLDGFNTELLNEALAAGHLPQLRRIQEAGQTLTLVHQKQFRNERCWEIFLTGTDQPHCGSSFDPARYAYFNESPQRGAATLQPPFYAQADLRVCTFDLLGPLVPGLPGLQLSGWGSELNAAAALSDPPGLMDEMLQRHGADPKLVTSMAVRDPRTGAPERSYRMPNLYDPVGTARFASNLVEAVQRRTAILLDLLQRGPWDLVLAAIVEGHSANHALWHWQRPHPAADAADAERGAVMRVMQAIDASIGQVRAALAPGQPLAVLTLDHTVANTMDLPTMAFLPEWLLRWNFPGRVALVGGEPAGAPPVWPADRHWKEVIWGQCSPWGRAHLSSPQDLEAQGEALSWNPARWYQPLWPQMKVFALPSVSDGYVRLNVQGREANGQVAPADYDATLAQLEQGLRGLRDGRTGQPLVQRLQRTRRAPHEHPELPPDLIVCWAGETPTDRAECPLLGRLGPLPFFRSGGHVAHGTEVLNPAYGLNLPGPWAEGERLDLAAFGSRLMAQLRAARQAEAMP
ncbi:hypothetical protein [Inhella gelatinilytica]|uniref:Type I phosphodiesterase/nucleotide pyrophosphatase n=1 Tax=Inhella gelatinilytica TaxID=2795030 RepID=A0A931NFA3_9BURK|nr:hypothetical protein [Inhella gelatinilytica]MBH9553326.1 hypothetical protein [Inhella gelatinilytica]